MVRSGHQIARERATLRKYGLILLLVGLMGILFALRIVPGELRIVDGSTDFSLASLLLGSSAAMALGFFMFLVSVRGIDVMSVTDDGIVFPVRSLRHVVLNRPNVIPVDRVREAIIFRTTRGRTLVKFRFVTERGREKTVAYSIESADSPEEFERLLGEHVPLRHASAPLESLVEELTI